MRPGRSHQQLVRCERANAEVDKAIAVGDNAGAIRGSNRGRRRQVGGIDAFNVNVRENPRPPACSYPSRTARTVWWWSSWADSWPEEHCCRWQSLSGPRNWPRKQRGRKPAASRQCLRRQWLIVCGDRNEEITYTLPLLAATYALKPSSSKFAATAPVKIKVVMVLLALVKKPYALL